MGRKSREKGKRGEQDAARVLRDVFPDVRSKRAGGESLEIDRGRDLLGTPGFCVQVQLSAVPTPLKKWREACAVTRGTEIPLALVRQSSRSAQSPWLAVIELEVLVGLIALSKSKTLDLARQVADESPDALAQGRAHAGD